MARANKALDTSITTVEVLEELTPDEERERQRLEWKVEKAFYEAGASLRLLRDKRLYRSTHPTFESYCHDRFGYHRRHCYQLIDAAAVVENLCANSAQIFHYTCRFNKLIAMTTLKSKSVAAVFLKSFMR